MLIFVNVAGVYQAAIKKCPFSVAVKNNLFFPECEYKICMYVHREIYSELSLWGGLD